MDFKFFTDNKAPTLYFQPHTFEPQNVEFCFQFGDEEPVVFATGPNECSIRLNPTNDTNMIFNDNGRVFKLFAREREND
jgi:hypothetical protein